MQIPSIISFRHHTKTIFSFRFYTALRIDDHLSQFAQDSCFNCNIGFLSTGMFVNPFFHPNVRVSLHYLTSRILYYSRSILNVAFKRFFLFSKRIRHIFRIQNFGNNPVNCAVNCAQTTNNFLLQSYWPQILKGLKICPLTDLHV